MYCSICGSEVNAELNYCKRCGARVDKLAVREKSSAASYLSIATGFVGFGGLGLTITLISILLERGVTPFVIVILVLAFLCTVFGITLSMLQQISRMSNVSSPANEKFFNDPQLNSPRTARLEEPRQPAVSITENTTRTLENELVK